MDWKSVIALAMVICTLGAIPVMSEEPARGLSKVRINAPTPSVKNEQLPPPKAEDTAKPLEPEIRVELSVPRVATLSSAPPIKALELLEVLSSVNRHFPLLKAALQEREIALGNAISADGLFDTQLKGHVRQNQGSFDSQRYALSFSQPTAFQGISFGGGWRLGAGIYPVYYQDRQTAEGGEFFGGVTVPLLKDREIDFRRAGRRRASLDRQIAEPLIASQHVRFVRDASWAYWNWVAAAKRLEIGKELLRIAEGRDELLRKQAKLGRIAEIEVTDNRRTVLDRRARLVRIQRDFELASYTLSLFVRDEKGVPIHLASARLAPEIPTPAKPSEKELIEGVHVALANRPELAQLRLQIKRMGVDLDLAKNQTLPDLRLFVNHATDVGEEKKSLDRYAYEAGVLLEVPFQRRQAIGQIRTTRARLAQLFAQDAFLRESITTDVQKAVAQLIRAYEVSVRTREVVRLAEIMEKAEQRKLELGRSTVLIVNLRELARADAQAQVVDALADYFRAWAAYRASLGLSFLPRK